MPTTVPEELSKIVEAIYRSESGRILATLVRLLGDLASTTHWFLSSKEPSQPKGLPPILIFAIAVAKWSDGTVAPVHQE
jgi:hypothetical protein